MCVYIYKQFHLDVPITKMNSTKFTINNSIVKINFTKFAVFGPANWKNFFRKSFGS